MGARGPGSTLSYPGGRAKRVLGASQRGAARKRLDQRAVVIAQPLRPDPRLDVTDLRHLGARPKGAAAQLGMIDQRQMHRALHADRQRRADVGLERGLLANLADQSVGGIFAAPHPSSEQSPRRPSPVRVPRDQDPSVAVVDHRDCSDDEVGIECPEEHMSDPQRQPLPDPRADRSTVHRGVYFGGSSSRPAAGPERAGRARADRASGRARRTGPPRTGRRARQVPWPAFARLPRRGYVIEEKHLRRFRTLLRQVGDLPLSRDTTFAGLLHMGEEGNEIWVEAGLPEPEKQFTIVHELVHARRQRSSEDLADDSLEEAIDELEAVARVSKRILKRMPSGVVLSVLHDYLTGRGRNNPDTRAGLGAIYRRIWILLGARTTRRATVSRVAARPRPKASRLQAGS